MPEPEVSRSPTSKRTLVTVSHAIEQLALAEAEDGPALVVALFQREPYFDREQRVYGRIAERAVTVVGFAAEPDGQPDAQLAHQPNRPVVALFDEQDALAREWSVVVLTPRVGAVLIAHDLERVDASAPTLEAGRLFDGSWSFRRDDALHEAIRLRNATRRYLTPATLSAMDTVLDRVRELPAAPGEARVDAAVRFLIRAAQRNDSAVVAQSPAHTPEQPPLLEDGPFRRWIGADSTTASGTLQIALLAIRIAHVEAQHQRPGRRGAGVEMIGVLRILQQVQRPVDRLIQLDRDHGGEYLLLMPTLTQQDAVSVAQRITTDVSGLKREFPFADMRVTSAVTATRRRPLPIPELRDALAWAVEHDVPIAALPAGDTANVVPSPS